MNYKKKNKPKPSRRNEIINIREEINKIEIQKTIGKNQSNQEVVLWKGKQNWQAYGQTHQVEERKTQINKIRNEKGEITINNAEIQKSIKEYYEQFYVKKSDNLEEMTTF